MVYKLDSISDEEIKRRVRNEIIEECARIAFSHNGISPKDSRDIAAKIRNLAGKEQL